MNFFILLLYLLNYKLKRKKRKEKRKKKNKEPYYIPPNSWGSERGGKNILKLVFQVSILDWKDMSSLFQVCSLHLNIKSLKCDLNVREVIVTCFSWKLNKPNELDLKITWMRCMFPYVYQKISWNYMRARDHKKVEEISPTINDLFSKTQMTN